MPRPSAGLRSALCALAAATALCGATAAPAFANNFGESAAWQFATPSDIAAQAALRDLIERRRGGGYAAPLYTTNIARQYNCSIAATATGNSGAQSAIANSPSTVGATSTATGNSNTASTSGDRSSPDIANGQLNGGPVSATLIGATTSRVDGAAWQALNSEQANSGNQSANAANAQACAFGALN